MDTEEFRVRGKEMVDYICDYMDGLSLRRVTPNVEPGYLRELLPPQAPQHPEDWDTIMADVDTKIMPGVTHWQHPRFHAYFPSGNSYPSILGDMLSDAIGCIGFSWAASPVCAELETIVLDWFGKAIGLPEEFIASSPGSKGGGVIQSSASECILVSMLAARAQAITNLKKENPDTEDSAFLPKLVAYCSQEAHSCVEKAAMISLVKLHILEPDDRCSLRGCTLQEAMEEDVAKGLVPFFVSTTLGSTSCCSFDNLTEIGPVCHRFPAVWLHVDGAYAGNAFICPENKPLMAGMQYANSFNTNPNKWLLVNFDCSAYWVRDRIKLTSALVVDPLYLQHANSDESIDYRHWGVPLSRRFRALKLWFVLRKYGIEGLQSYIRNHCRLAKSFEALVRKDSRFEVINEVKMGLVCFRLLGTDRLNQDLLASINGSGKLHMIPSLVKGRYIIRFCVIAEHANEADIEHAWEVIQEHTNEVLDSYKIEKVAPVPVKPATPEITPKPPMQRILSRRLSFTRSVSREVYKRSLSRSSLHDGATPIIVPEDEDNIIPENDNIDEEEEEEDEEENDDCAVVGAAAVLIHERPVVLQAPVIGRPFIKQAPHFLKTTGQQPNKLTSNQALQLQRPDETSQPGMCQASQSAGVRPTDIVTTVDHKSGTLRLGWKCPVCTLVNSPTRPGCAACTTERPLQYVVPVEYRANEQELHRMKQEQQVDNEFQQITAEQRRREAEDQHQHYLQLVDLDNTDLVPNAEAFECSVCLVQYEAGEGVVLRDCLHIFCRACLANTVQFNEEAEVKCPYRDAEYACNSVLQEREIKALVPADIYEQHLAKSVAQAENKIGNAFHCKTPDCRGWCIFEDNVNEFRCPVCRRTNCLTCQAIHDGMNCKQYQEQVKQESETNAEARRTKEMLEEMVERGEAMNCPTCQVVLMKKWGCDWLRCSMCKTEICWVTRGPRWGPGGKGDTTGGCQCGVNGVKCHPRCNYCH